MKNKMFFLVFTYFIYSYSPLPVKLSSTLFSGFILVTFLHFFVVSLAPSLFSPPKLSSPRV